MLGDRYALRSGPSVYMCGHAEYLLRRVDRPGERSFLSWPGRAEALVEWLNAQLPHDPADGAPVLLEFASLLRHRCGHGDFRLYVPYRSGHADVTEDSAKAADGLVAWLNREPPRRQPRHDLAPAT